MTDQPMCPNEALKHLCKGCQKRRFKYIRCSFHNNNQIEKCPCTTCLVKAMCRDICNERTNCLSRVIRNNERLRKEWADRMRRIEKEYKNEPSV